MDIDCSLMKGKRCNTVEEFDFGLGLRNFLNCTKYLSSKQKKINDDTKLEITFNLISFEAYGQHCANDKSSKSWKTSLISMCGGCDVFCTLGTVNCGTPK